LVLTLEEALKRYETLKKERNKELERIEEDYWKHARELIERLLDIVNDLGEKEEPRNVDENLLKIALRDRARYVTSMRRMLSEVSSMEELGRKLPEITKFHVSMGRYLLIVFEREMRDMNSLMKELGALYTEYSDEVASKSLPDVDLNITELVSEIERIEREKRELEEKVKDIENAMSDLKKLLTEGREDRRQETSESVEIGKKVRTLRIQIRSKVSKLQKPLKRMRIPEAEGFIKDSSFAIEHPDEFIAMLTKVYPRLDGKYKRTARWAVENLRAEVEKLRELEEQLSAIRREKEIEEERAREVRREIQDREREIKRMRERIHRLEKMEEGLRSDLRARIKELEDALNEEISMEVPR